MLYEYQTKLEKDRCLKLVKGRCLACKEESKVCTTPESVMKLMNELYDLENMAEEYVYALYFSEKLKCLGISEISHGTTNLSIVNTKDVIKRALLLGSGCIILVHNHPSGNCTPSREDIALTQKVEDACRLMDMKLLDHVIIGHGICKSLKDK